ncbi:uncharacterized protein [Physcomitrium patens]|uniref:Uncharacterized protein n=1 Tax=Physcomitrium patens TaxID=3218 RepID=A0A2K1IQI2_PHYPA|nr:cold shock protein 2-like isoform X1 [Physcomitrium patens]PNR31533.1 hypothetical protein PHYPA_025654 [Physcomitrium patens]|eukprot:XP_024358831.1 cold shock protein 2-like isoform X1 [Physcomitrella patens]
MFILFGAAVAIIVFEAASILTLTGICASHGKKKRLNSSRPVADAGQGNMRGTGGNGRVRNGGVIHAPGVGGGDGAEYDYRRTYGFKGGDYGDTDGYGNDGRSNHCSSSRSRGGDGDGGGDVGGDYGGDGGGCGGGGCGGGCSCD